MNSTDDDDDVPQHPPPPHFTVADEVRCEAVELMSAWPHVPRAGAVAALEGTDLLATWGHARRFPADVSGSADLARFAAFVRAEAGLAAERFLASDAPASWQASAEALTRGWDEVDDPLAAEELERAARDLFDQLDRHSLAAYAARALLPPDDARRPRLDAVAREVDRGERYLLENPESFYPAAAVAAEQVRAYRADLHAADAELWETTVKHRVLADLRAAEGRTAARRAVPIERPPAARPPPARAAEPKPRLRIGADRRDPAETFNASESLLFDFGELLRSAVSRDVPVFPFIWEDVPQVAVWSVEVGLDPLQAAGLRRAWFAYFDGRFFMLAHVDTAMVGLWGKGAVHMILPGGGGNVESEPLRCPQLHGGEPGRVWSFLPLLGTAGGGALLVYATPLERAAELSWLSCTLSVNAAGVVARALVPSIVDVSRASAELLLLWSTADGLSDGRTFDASREALVDMILSHRFRPGSLPSETMAFYAFWAAQAQGRDGKLLGDASAARLRSAFAGPTAWPPALAERVRQLLADDRGDVGA